METKGHNLLNEYVIFVRICNFNNCSYSNFIAAFFFYIYFFSFLQRLSGGTNLCTCTVGPGKPIGTFCLKLNVYRINLHKTVFGDLLPFCRDYIVAITVTQPLDKGDGEIQYPISYQIFHISCFVCLWVSSMLIRYTIKTETDRLKFPG